MIDKLTDTLVNAGPLGILCAVLLVLIAALSKVVIELFRMYADAQESRIKQGLELQFTVQKQTDVVQGLRDLIHHQRK